MTSRRPLTPLDDLAARLHADPEFAARWKKEREERHKQGIADYRIAAAPVVQSLREAGIDASSISAAKKDPSAIPVLLEHLQKPYPRRVLWSIAVALAVPAARFAWSILVSEYKKWPAYGPGEQLGPKDGLANALAATVTKDTIDELIALARDPSHGSSRLLLLNGIRRSRTPQAKRAIEELAFDPQLAKEIASWPKMRKRGATN